MDDDKFADFGVLSIYKPERFLLISNNEQQTGRLDQSLSFVSLFLEGAQVTKRISVAETDVKHVKREGLGIFTSHFGTYPSRGTFPSRFGISPS